MDGKTSQVKAMLVEPTIVRGLGTLAILGAVAFLIAGLHLIALYLFLSGAAFWISSLRWTRRYENVVDSPPEGFRPTGEVYANPGGDGPVAVYFKGIRRIYVKVSE
jgi:hypothetical protein